MRLLWTQIAVILLLLAFPSAAPAPPVSTGPFSAPIVYTSLPLQSKGDPWDGARLLLREPGGTVRILSEEFHSAADPEISFDGERLLFAAQRTPGEHWQIFEMNLDGTGVRQLTRMAEDCRHPVYESRFFTLDAPTPWDQVGFVAGGQLYTVPLTPSDNQAQPQQVTFLPGTAGEPVVAMDGRVLFSYRETSRGTSRLFGINLDGTDYALLNGDANGGMQMAAVLGDRLVFVESASGDRLGAGALATLDLLRPQRTYGKAAAQLQARFHSPSFLPDGRLLAALQEGNRFSLVLLDSSLNSYSPLQQDPRHHLVQPKLVAARPLPDGRGSVVDPNVSWALLYCLNVYTNDFAGDRAMPPGSVRRVRVLENPSVGGTPLGDAPVEADGSFHMRVPANQPLRLELLGAESQVLRRSAWIYARNKEARGCIGCHEDPELTPTNREALAVNKPAVDLTRRASVATQHGGTP